MYAENLETLLNRGRMLMRYDMKRFKRGLPFTILIDNWKGEINSKSDKIYPRNYHIQKIPKQRRRYS